MGYRPFRNTCPAVSPVNRPSETLTHPLTSTYSMPTGYWLGSRKVPLIDDGVGVEDHDVRVGPRTQHSLVMQAQPLGRERRHLSHRLFQGENALFPNVSAQNARIGAVDPWMGIAQLEQPVGADHGVWAGHHRPHVLLVH